ncbi:glycosyltransferase family 4 protein [Sporosarcina sp. E16_8]|uniref:glycosyltransferase family 4 protein n=1 Tax=Sporosarcina sp. E16_8 TaxID=2789295 RepID=UPI002107D19F|nr:glycosyltransferase family 4 protein [Sporosarcina sp. E16_8]
MKKILFVATVYHHLASFHKPFMKMFHEKGFEVHAIGSNSMGRKNELTAMGIICHDMDFYRIPLSSKNIRALKTLDDLIRHEYFELIHVHTPTAAFLTRYIASKHKQGKIIYTAHGFHFYKGAPMKNWLLFYFAEKLAVRWTDGLIVMNKEDYQLGKKLGYKEKENLFKVHGVGVNLAEFQSTVRDSDMDIREELGVEDDALIVCCIAELSARKNHFFLLGNWKSIVAKCPTAHLVLVGTGKSEKEIKEYIESNRIPNVHLIGFRSDINQIISSSDIVTLVSKHEGLPKCLMEAMACAKIVVTTNVRGSRDLVEHESTGIVVGLGDGASLVESFVTVLRSKQLRLNYGRNGLQKIQNYSLHCVLQEMDDIYERYLNDERSNANI